jgi:hypothetical protein
MLPLRYRMGCSRKRKQVARWTHPRHSAAVGEETVPDDFRLLFEAIVFEAAPGLELVAVATKGVAHQRQVESSSLLRLPDMRQLVDE